MTLPTKYGLPHKPPPAKGLRTQWNGSPPYSPATAKEHHDRPHRRRPESDGRRLEAERPRCGAFVIFGGVMLSVAEAAKRLGVSPRTVYDLAAPAGPIPCHRIGRRIVFSQEDLTEYLQQCRYTEIKKEVATFLSSTVS